MKVKDQWKAACIKHVEFEGLGHVTNWLEQNNIQYDTFEVFKEVVFPDPKEYQLLFIMGGPMSVNDLSIPFIKKEKEFLKKHVSDFKFIVGFCLGAQLIAKTLGSNVYKSKMKEIGWYDVEYVGQYFTEIPMRFKTFHWHGETFEIPFNSEHLFKTEEVINQGFIKYNCLGIQFHPEITETSIKSLIENCKRELDEDSEKIQVPTEMINNNDMIKMNNEIIGNVLDQFILNKYHY